MTKKTIVNSMFFLNCIFLFLFSNLSHSQTYGSKIIELSRSDGDREHIEKVNYILKKNEEGEFSDSIRVGNRNLVEVTFLENSNSLKFTPKGNGEVTVIIIDENEKSHLYEVKITSTADSSNSLFIQLGSILGKKGVIFIIFAMFFVYVMKHSHILFDWIDDQTHGTRNYILEKAELLFLEFNSDKVKYFLLFLYFGNGLLVASIFTFFGKIYFGIFLGIVLSLVGWKAPRPFMDFLIRRRIKKYQGQMVDGLNLMANGLRAGLSLPQSIGMVVDELPAPISQEFNFILQQNKIGLPLDECFETLNVRVPTPDNQMFVTSVNVLRETGGNLAETFDTIIDVIKERVRLQQKIDTYVAQGMTQGYILFSMPWVLGGVFILGNPETFEKITTNPFGIFLISLAMILDCIGLYVILKMVKIEV